MSRLYMTLAFAILLITPAMAAKHKKPVTVVPVADSGEQLIWKLRSALNVAALQCQFDPNLKMVENYKTFLTSHTTILDQTRITLTSRMGINAFDHYSTQLVNTFSAVDVQVAFCAKAAAVAMEADIVSDAELAALARTRVPEIQAVFPTKVAVKPATTGKLKLRSKRRHR